MRFEVPHTKICPIQALLTKKLLCLLKASDLSQLLKNWLHKKCDLSRENVPNGSRSNAERNGKRTGDERLGKPFETGNVNG